MLSIENLTRIEKLRMMEVIWDDLSRDSETFSSPEWHAQALKDAERALAENRTHFVSWNAAKKMLRDSTQ
ncbi:MAG: acyl-protein synthetase [Gallionellales bacterium RIFCSPLOWO2_02_FULL_57_47]|nr:MAG: acyl-protein synthetase [Gallionellales bacterium RIFCSPLOWO2_02_FULL_57_47]OGT15109.1 MAG: acyl-protein synthetase [Gallionellales bacterium RIFCSPHIGHO2_02_FULL_57_16]